MLYRYKNKLPSPDLAALEVAILASSIAETYDYFEWDGGCNTINKPTCRLKCEQPCNGDLFVILNRELTIEEKIILDGLVSLV